jgi:hypothetical protein
MMTSWWVVRRHAGEGRKHGCIGLELKQAQQLCSLKRCLGPGDMQSSRQWRHPGAAMYPDHRPAAAASTSCVHLALQYCLNTELCVLAVCAWCRSAWLLSPTSWLLFRVGTPTRWQVTRRPGCHQGLQGGAKGASLPGALHCVVLARVWLVLSAALLACCVLLLASRCIVLSAAKICSAAPSCCTGGIHLTQATPSMP